MVIARKLAEECCKYGIENQDSAHPLAQVSSDFGTARASMEDQRETMLQTLSYQVSEPLRAFLNGAPLEDARHLTHRYDRMRQEFEIQAAEVIRRQSKFRDASSETLLKLKTAEKKLAEHKSSMAVIGKEATSAMLSVEDHQQEATFQKLLAMVDAEKLYHQNMITILEKLHSKMMIEEAEGSSLRCEIPERDNEVSSVNDEPVSVRTTTLDEKNTNGSYFSAKAVHSFDAQGDGELTLEVGDDVIVRQVGPNGWSEGECKGRIGWFPSAYVLTRESSEN